MMPLICVVDGMVERRNFVQFALEQAGYRVKVFTTAGTAEIAEQGHPSLIVVAIDAPDGSGCLLCEGFRLHPTLSSTPIFLLANSEIDRQRVLKTVSAEGCLSYPFPAENLLRAMQDVLSGNGAFGSSSEADEIIIDPSAMKVSVGGKEITTTVLEFRLLAYLAQHQGIVFSRDALLDAVWGDIRFVTPRSVDACIRRIRRKIEPGSSSPRFLRTIRGMGYKLEATPTWQAAAEACQCARCAAARDRSKVADPANLGRSSAFRRAVSCR